MGGGIGDFIYQKLLSFKVYFATIIKTFVINLWQNTTLRNILTRNYTLINYTVYIVSIYYIHNVNVHNSGMHRWIQRWV